MSVMEDLKDMKSVRRVRMSLGLKQEYLASKLRVDQTTFSKYERGKLKPKPVVYKIINGAIQNYIEERRSKEGAESISQSSPSGDSISTISLPGPDFVFDSDVSHSHSLTTEVTVTEQSTGAIQETEPAIANTQARQTQAAVSLTHDRSTEFLRRYLWRYFVALTAVIFIAAMLASMLAAEDMDEGFYAGTDNPYSESYLNVNVILLMMLPVVWVAAMVVKWFRKVLKIES